MFYALYSDGCKSSLICFGSIKITGLVLPQHYSVSYKFNVDIIFAVTLMFMHPLYNKIPTFTCQMLCQRLFKLFDHPKDLIVSYCVCALLLLLPFNFHLI